MLKIQTLASGSGGNAIYIASDTTRILVDVGLSMPRLAKRFDAAKIDPDKIDAVLVTHEHIDHIAGLDSFIKRFSASLYIHEKTASLFANISADRIQIFGNSPSDTFQIGDISINFFSVPHDSKFCFGYSFRNGSGKISIATDLGRVTDEILSSMAGSQLAVLECNHDLLRLTGNKKYPLTLKRRISGSFGHLSNPASALAIYKLVQTGLSQVILAHLSEENNSPSLAFNFVKEFLQAKGIVEGQDIWIDVASQDTPGRMFEVGGNNASLKH